MKRTAYFLIISTMMLSACAKRVSSTSESSRVGDTTQASLPISTCSKGADKVTPSSLSLLLHAVSNSNQGYYQEWMAAGIKNLPSDFATDALYIQFWRWKANSETDIYFDSSAPLDFHIVRADTGAYLNSSSQAYQKITFSELRELIVSQNMTGSTPEEVLKQVRFMLNTRDTTLSFDVIRLNLYTTDTHKSRFQVDALMPAFYANPNDYKGTNLLLELHPFYDRKSQSWSNSDYQSFAATLCDEYFLY